MQNHTDRHHFVVFCGMLVSLFNLFCFRCKSDTPAVRMKKNGKMVTVTQDCLHSGDCAFTWRSQPQIFGRYPAENTLLPLEY